MTNKATQHNFSLLIILLLLVLVFFSSCDSNNTSDNKETAINLSDSIVTEPQLPYQIILDSAIYQYDTIGINDYLGNILSHVGVAYETIDRIAKTADTVFSVKKFRQGNVYCILFSPDSIAKYFVYEINSVEFVVYDFSNLDSVTVYRDKKPVILKSKAVGGVIESSLWLSMKKAKASPLLALYLSDVFAWTIDFYHIQKGDEFKAIYDENWVNDQRVSIHHVVAAEMMSNHSSVYAFWFDKDSISDYFDSSGHSMRKAFLKAPLKFSRITSRYSTKRYHPILHRNKAHLGTDFAAPYGTPILATGDGVISRKGFSGGNGRFVKIRHNSVYSTQYLHMSKFVHGLAIGDHVKQGDVIGYVGSSGLATGPHVCYRFWKNGQQVDPFKEKLPPSKPLPQIYQKDFEAVRDSLLIQLHRIAPNPLNLTEISSSND